MKRIFLSLFFLLLTGFALFIPAQAKVRTEYQTAFTDLPFTCAYHVCLTPEIKSEFLFNSFFIESSANAKTRVRFFEKGTWTPWLVGEGENDTPDGVANTDPYQGFFLSYGQAYQIETSSDALTRGRVTYFAIPPYQKVRTDRIRMAANEMPVDLAIKSRDNWLDPALEIPFLKRDELWPAGYEGVKKIIIHHTASTIRDMNGDMSIDSNDYRLAVRAIYQFHAKSRKWGDLGYHYIIDPEGNIWEGRFGGDGVVGGHTHREKSCKKFGQSGIGFNKGSIGIALLGDYEQGDISPQAKEALTSLIAKKAWEFEFEPAGSSFFIDREYPNVIAHRDVDCTTCPGQKLHTYVPTIVAQAQDKYQLYASFQPRIFAGEMIDVFPKTVELKQGEERTVTIRYRNTGTSAWRNYGDSAVYLADARIKEHLASLDSLHLAAVDESERGEIGSATSTITDFSRAQLITPNVRPGEIGTFILTVKDPPKDLIEERHYVIAVGKRGWMPLQEIVLEVVNTGILFAATVAEPDATQELFDEEKQTLVLRFQNRGTEIWKKGDIALSLMATDDESMNLGNDAWKHKRGRIFFLEDQVSQGASATFQVPITLHRVGEITNTIFLEKGKERIIGSDRKALRLFVKPMYAAELISSTIPAAMLGGWRPLVGVTVKNVGTKNWDAAMLASNAKGKGKKSIFQDRSWKSDTHIDTAQGVEAGVAASFLYKMKSPKRVGMYTEKLALTQGKRTIYFLTDKGFEKELIYQVRVDASKVKKKIKGR